MSDSILGEIFETRFNDGSFKIRDDSLILYSNIERITNIVGFNIDANELRINALIGGMNE